MKFIALALVTMIAGTVHADYTVQYHDYDAALRGIKLNNACVTATEVRTINPQVECTELVPVEVPARGDSEMAHTDWVCKSRAATHLAFPRAFQKTVCLEVSNRDQDAGTCLRSEVVTTVLPSTIKVGEYVESSRDSGGNFPGVSKSFTFPSCGTVEAK